MIDRTVTIALKESKRNYLDRIKKDFKLKSFDELFDLLIPHIDESIKLGTLQGVKV